MLRNMSKKIRARGSRQADAQKKPAWLPHCSGPRKQHFKTRPPRQQQLSLEVSSAWRDRKKHLMIGFQSYLGSKPTRDRGANERGGVPRAKTCLLKKRYNTNRRRFVHYIFLKNCPRLTGSRAIELALDISSRPRYCLVYNTYSLGTVPLLSNFQISV